MLKRSFINMALMRLELAPFLLFNATKNGEYNGNTSK